MDISILLSHHLVLCTLEAGAAYLRYKYLEGGKSLKKFTVSVIFIIFMMFTPVFCTTAHAESVEKQTSDYTLYTSGKLVIHKNADKFFDEHTTYKGQSSYTFPTLGSELITYYVARSYYVNTDVNHIVIECPNTVKLEEILWYYPYVTRLDLSHKNTELYKDSSRLLKILFWNEVNYDTCRAWEKSSKLFAELWNKKIRTYVSTYSRTYNGYVYYYATINHSNVTVTNSYRDPNEITASGCSLSASGQKQTCTINASCLGGTLSYKSNNSNITVSQNGTVTIKKKYVGTATITISTKGDDYYKAASKKVKITVRKQKTAISIGNKTCYISRSKKSYALKPKTNSAVTLTYKSNNKNITVNRKGVLTVKKGYSGRAKITIYTKGNSYSTPAKKVISVTVTKRKNPITASDINTTYSTGKKVFSLNASCPGKTRLNYKSNNSLIKVSSKGTVTITAGYVGSATITISTAGNLYYKPASITVSVTVNDNSGNSNNNSNNNSSHKNNTTRECQQCVGKGGIPGECYLCHGEGGHWYGPSFNRRWSTCLSCHGRKTCQYCGGDGIKGN